MDEKNLYDAQSNDLLGDEYPTLICIPVLHQTNLVTATDILFIIAKISMKNIHLRKGQILHFLEHTDIDSNDFTTETVYGTVLQNSNYCLNPTSDTEDNSLIHNENSMKEKIFTTSPTDIEVYHNVDLTDATCR